MSAGASKAAALDLADPLRDKRELFELPAGIIYLDGNSLGPPPKAAFAELEQAARREWGEGLIRSWTAAGWCTASTSGSTSWPRAICCGRAPGRSSTSAI